MKSTLERTQEHYTAHQSWLHLGMVGLLLISKDSGWGRPGSVLIHRDLPDGAPGFQFIFWSLSQLLVGRCRHIPIFRVRMPEHPNSHSEHPNFHNEHPNFHWSTQLSLPPLSPFNFHDKRPPNRITFPIHRHHSCPLRHPCIPNFHSTPCPFRGLGRGLGAGGVGGWGVCFPLVFPAGWEIGMQPCPSRVPIPAPINTSSAPRDPGKHSTATKEIRGPCDAEPPEREEDEERDISWPLDAQLLPRPAPQWANSTWEGREARMWIQEASLHPAAPWRC